MIHKTLSQRGWQRGKVGERKEEGEKGEEEGRIGGSRKGGKVEKEREERKQSYCKKKPGG